MSEKPYISAETQLTELSLRAMIIGAMLSVILGAANAYFGLFSGLTVSASIPAAVISIAILKAFKNANILENNMVQTAASAGESLAAGVIFTIPALVIMGYWQAFNYIETVLIAISGGVLGVLFTVPLRKALIVKEKLMFPEGVATAEVLKTGEKGGDSVKYLVFGGVIGGLFKLSAEALHLFSGLLEKAALLQNKFYFYFSLNLSPALVAVGYIVGLNISFLVFLGGVISWYLGIPVYILIHGAPEAATAEAVGNMLWSIKIRYLGVGAMVVGGLWALLSLRSALGQAFGLGLQAFKKSSEKAATIIRTELDTPMSVILLGIGVLIVPVFFIYLNIIGEESVSLLLAFIMILAGFLFSAVAGYMAGLVGSSNNPVSGVTIATILSTALLLLLLIGTSDPAKGASGAILVGAVVACAAAIAADNMQDLKAGHVLGATPRNQQIMQMIGVAAGALLITPVLNLLLESRGIGIPTPEHPDPLLAPQATLMMSVATGIFGGELPWTIIIFGAVIGVGIIITDLRLKSKGSKFRMPVLAVAVGLYLPFQLDAAIFVGGGLAWLLERGFSQLENREFLPKARNAGLLIASGLITGEALIGILVALLASFGIGIALFEKSFGGGILGLFFLTLILVHMYTTVNNISKKG